MTNLKLRTDQIADLAFYIAKKKVLNLSEPGTGKTPSVVVNQYRREMNTVWVMPKSLLQKNKDEIVKFTPLTPEDVIILDGSKKEISNLVKQEKKVMLMGPTRLKLSREDIPSCYKACDVDEFHMCFSGQSGRTEAWLNFMRNIEECVLMSGTLIDGKLDTAWPAIHAIEPRYYPFGYASFLNAHAYLDEYGKPYGWKNHAKIAAIFGKHGIRHTFKDVYGDQEIISQIEEVFMDTKHRQLFDDMESEALIELEDMFLTAPDPGVNLIRCRQIMEHPQSYPDPQNPEERIDLIGKERWSTAKLERLKVLIEDHARTGDPFIVFSTLIPQQRDIISTLRQTDIKFSYLLGDQNKQRNDLADKDFRAGKIQALVVSPSVASVGFNWQFCGEKEVNHIIWASLPYKDSDYIQGIRRAIRKGRSSPLRNTVLSYANCSVETRMRSLLRKKSLVSHKVNPDVEIINFNNGE